MAHREAHVHKQVQEHKEHKPRAKGHAGKHTRRRRHHAAYPAREHVERKVAELDDAAAKVIEAEWKEHVPGAAVLPVIGFPSNSGGVVTLTHGMEGPKMKINGLTSKSPLANNALYSTEIAENGQYLNLYEVMLPDIPGNNGDPSTVQIYVNALGKEDLDVAGNHYHWTGGMVGGVHALAIHHQNIGMNPLEFTRRTLRALMVAMEAIKARGG